MSEFNERTGSVFEPVKSVSNQEVLEKNCLGHDKRLGRWAWCHCFGCELMPNFIENVHCFDDIAVKNKIKDEKCIAMSSSFRKICLDAEILEVFLSLLSDVAEDSPTQYTNR